MPRGQSGKNNRGFTIIEIMVIVAIMAILAGISIPQYQRMVNKGNQQGAVAALTSTYMAEKNFAAENHTYTSCLSSIGVVAPGGTNSKQWYTFGFNGQDLGASCGPNGAYNCNTSAWDEGAAVATCVTCAGGASCGAGSDYFKATYANNTTAGVPDNRFLGTLSSDMTNTT